MKKETAVAIREELGIAVSDQLGVEIDLCRRWGRPLETLNRKRFVKRGGKYVLVPRAREIDIFAVLNGEERPPVRDAVTGLPSRQAVPRTVRGTDKGFHDEWKLQFTEACSVEVRELQ